MVFKSLVLAGVMVVGAGAQDIDTGTFQKSGNVIQDPEVPVSFRPASGFVFASGLRWGVHQTTLRFVDTESGIAVSFYYQYPSDVIPQDAEGELRKAMEAKVTERVGEGFADYKVRPDSVQDGKVNGQPSLRFAADYTMEGRPVVEYMVRVLGQTSRAHFFFQAPAAVDFTSLLARLAPMVASLRIP